MYTYIAEEKLETSMNMGEETVKKSIYDIHYIGYI